MKQTKSKLFMTILGIFLFYTGIVQSSLCLQTAYFKDCKCGDDWTVRIDGGYTFGQFIGMKKSYGEIGLFIAPKHVRKAQNFFDVRGYLVESGEGAISVGIGRRLWDVDSCRILGANLYYDCRHARRGVFNRIGFGLESLGECVDFRVNGYFPFHGGTRQGSLHTFDDFIGPFVETCQEKEFAYLGFDAEVGRYLWSNCYFDLYGAIGPYAYHHKERQGTYGGFVRANLTLAASPWLLLEVRASSDNRYHTHVQGSVILSFPLDYLILCNPCENLCRELLTQPVERNGLIFTDSCCHRTFNWDTNN